MKIKISFPAKAFLITGSILLIIGIGPILIEQFFFPTMEIAIIYLLFLLVAPLGAVIFAIGLLVLLVNLLKNIFFER